MRRSQWVDILVFLIGQDDIDAVVQLLEEESRDKITHFLVEGLSLASKLRSLSSEGSSMESWKVLIKDLKVLSNNYISDSCIEHATCIMEEQKIPEKLSKGVSTMSLIGPEKKIKGKKAIELQAVAKELEQGIYLDKTSSTLEKDLSLTLPNIKIKISKSEDEMEE